jgi:hypothetical protein
MRSGGTLAANSPLLRGFIGVALAAITASGKQQAASSKQQAASSALSRALKAGYL